MCKTINDEGMVPIAELPVISEKASCHYCSKEDIIDRMISQSENFAPIMICHTCDNLLPTCPGCGEKVKKHEPRVYAPKTDKSYHFDCYESVAEWY